jgi:hypothetical protein
MRLLPGKQERLARLCQVMHLGERIAHHCAQRQAVLATEPRQRRFLLLQARQESMHALLFRSIVSRLDPRGNHANTPAIPSLSRYGEHLYQDIEQSDLAASLLGMQGTLEGIGERTLHAFAPFVSGQSERYQRLHRMVVQQESSHHAFGLHWLQCHQEDRRVCRAISAARLRYQALAQDLWLACVDLLEDLDIDAGIRVLHDTTPDERIIAA